MRKENNKNNMKKKICSISLSSVMILGASTPVFAAPLSKLPNVSDNSLVIGKHIFELDNIENSQYNINSLVDAAKTVDDKNNVYYKFSGKWYTGKDIESFTNLKNAKGLHNIPNDILKINGKDVKLKENNEKPSSPKDIDKPTVENKKIYNDGIYEGQGQGFKSYIKVSVTIKDDKITKVDIIDANDTKNYFQKAKSILKDIVTKQSSQVDNATGASCSSKGIKAAVQNALDKAKVDKPKETNKPQKPVEDNKNKLYKDGIYEGEGKGYHPSKKIKVSVTIKDGKISKIDMIENGETEFFFEKAKALIDTILNKQSMDVEAITGATCSSNGIKAAVQNALDKAKIIEDKTAHYPFTLSNYTQEGKENKVTFTKKPERVITTNQSATELLLTLGLEDCIVGTSYMDDSILPDLKDKYDKLPVLAKKYPSPEVAEATNPDCIIGWQSAFYGYGLGFPENWNAKGIPTFIQRNTVEKQTIENAYKDIEDIGRIFSIEDRAENLIKSMEDTISNVKNKVKDVKKPIKVMAIEAEGDDEYFAYGKNNLVGDLIEKAGGENIGDGYVWYGSEIAEVNPDAIIFIHYENESADRKDIEKLKNNPKLKDVNAIKNNNIISTSLAETYPGGIRLARTIEKFAKNFYPDLFKDSGTTTGQIKDVKKNSLN